MSARQELHERRMLAAAITGFLRPDDAGDDDNRGARAKPDGSILVIYGWKQGAFQTLSVPQAREYRDRLTAGERGAPWELGIR